MTPNFSAFRALIMHPIKFRLYMLAKLPMGFLAGLKLTQLEPGRAAVQVKYKWLTQNPFGSMYFAVLSMAAEFSTGILCLANIYKSDPAISMLVVKMESHFYKKAVGVITFTCNYLCCSVKGNFHVNYLAVKLFDASALRLQVIKNSATTSPF
jgi:hypothetical protein